MGFGEGSEEMGNIPSPSFLTQAQKDNTQTVVQHNSHMGLQFWTFALVLGYMKQLVTNIAQ